MASDKYIVYRNNFPISEIKATSTARKNIVYKAKAILKFHGEVLRSIESTCLTQSRPFFTPWWSIKKRKTQRPNKTNILSVALSGIFIVCAERQFGKKKIAFTDRRFSAWIQNVIFGHAFDVCHGAEDGVERADAEGIVVGNCQTMVTGRICFKNNMATSWLTRR